MPRFRTLSVTLLTLGLLASPVFGADPPTAIIPYKEVDGRELTLHIFDPETTGDQLKSPRPCLLLIHGGGWVKGSPQAYYFLARPLRDMGLVVACLEYRLYDKDATPPVSVIDAVADAQDGMRYLYAHAEELNIDPDRIIACGGSAGAHLAAGLALFDDQSKADDPGAYRPAALVLFNPVIDTSRQGYGYGKLKENWETYSPLHRLRPGLPPTIIFHGTGDRTVPYAGPVAFTEKAQANSDVCVLITNEGGDHGFYMKQPIRDQTMARIQQFLQEQGLINPAAAPGTGTSPHQ